jgi:hypothetical protein
MSLTLAIGLVIALRRRSAEMQRRVPTDRANEHPAEIAGQLAGVEQLGQVHDPNGAPFAVQATTDVNQASGIG